MSLVICLAQDFVDSEKRAQEYRKKQVLLKKSFDFLKKAQETLDHKKFIKLIKTLVEFDKGSLEVTSLVQTASELLPPHVHLLDGFKDFLPDKAKVMLNKLATR